jgi:hypothetical protein
MKSRYAMRGIAPAALLALAASMAALLAAAPAAAQGLLGTKVLTRQLTCYIVMAEGASSEANSLYLRKMGTDPEAVKNFAPTRFTLRLGAFSAVTEGNLSYEAGTPVLVDRSGKLVLYSLPLRISTEALPKARTTVTVQFRLKDLEEGRGLIQPSILAMRLAAAKAGMKSGIAWIVEMSRVGPGILRAKVALAD